MAGPTPQQKMEQAARRIRVAELYLRGEPQWQIAKKESVSPPTITRDLAAVRKEWAASRIEYMEEAIERELAKIDRLELEYHNAWVRSCQVAETHTDKTISDDEGDRHEVGVTKEFQAGDPRFLEGVRWCIDRRLKLFGKDAPAKHANTDIHGNDLHVPIEQKRNRLVAMLATICERGGTGRGNSSSETNGNGHAGGTGGNGKHGPLDSGPLPSDN